MDAHIRDFIHRNQLLRTGIIFSFGNNRLFNINYFIDVNQTYISNLYDLYVKLINITMFLVYN